MKIFFRSPKLNKQTKVSEMVFTNRTQLFASYLPQCFSLPDSIMHYISQNPTLPVIYEKIIQTCKHFYMNNSILVIRNLQCNCKDGWTSELFKMNLNNISSKLWILNSLNVNFKNFLNVDFPKEVYEKVVTSVIIPKIYECHVENLILHHQNITFEELEMIASFAKRIDLSECILKYKNGNFVELETIVEFFPNAERIASPLNPKITSETVKKLLKIPHFEKLRSFSVSGIPEEFDIERFYTYIKANKYTIINLDFNNNPISETYQNRLKEIVDEMLATKGHDYKVAFLSFPGYSFYKLNETLGIHLANGSIS